MLSLQQFYHRQAYLVHFDTFTIHRNQMADSIDMAGPSRPSKVISPGSFGPPTAVPGGRVPLRESVSSTSQLPIRDDIGHVAQPLDPQTHQQQVQNLLNTQAARIKQQEEKNDYLHRQMEHHWKLFQEEKAMWQATHAQLMNRICQVEDKLQQYTGTDRTPETPFAQTEQPVDPTLKDAGHTPMARWSLNMSTNTDGKDKGGDGNSSPKTTGRQLLEEEQQTVQRPVRQPSEQEDSYFGSTAAPVDMNEGNPPLDLDTAIPDDPPLTGPLGLTNSPTSERNVFILSEIDKKLNVTLGETAGNSQRSQTSSPSARNFAKAKQMPQNQNADGTIFEDPESEPQLRIKKNKAGDTSDEAVEPDRPLRIKQSQNFASALGQGKEVDYGKGFPGRG